jgi:hypothetical protein
MLTFKPMIFQRVKNTRYVFLVKMLLCFLAGIATAMILIHLFL